MKNQKFYQMHIRQRIQDASAIERVKFGFDVCRRFLEEYKKIGEETYMPGIDVLDKAMRLVSNYLEFQMFNEDESLELINQVDLIIPSTDNLTQSEASFAFNTVTSVSELLLYLGDNDTCHLHTISDLMIKTIEFKILENHEQISYETIDDHPVFINGLKYQLELFNKIDR